MKQFLTIVCLLAVFCVNAQRSSSSSAMISKDPKQSTAVTQARMLSTELGLSEKQAAYAVELMKQAERETAAMKAEHEQIRMKINAVYEKYAGQLELTNDQRNKMTTLYRSGEISPCCGGAAGCDHGRTDAKAGCCAPGKTSMTASPTNNGQTGLPKTTTR